MSVLLNLRINGKLFEFVDIENFIYEETIDGSSPFILEGITLAESWGDFDEFIHVPDTNTELRWGYHDLTIDKDIWSAWYNVVCSRSEMLYNKSQGQIGWIIEGHDAGYRIKENITNKVYKDKTVSQIVQEIASDNNLSSEVATTTGKYHLFQCNKNDGRFIKEELLPRAYSGSSNAFTCYFRHGKTLVFEPIGYGGTYDIYKDIGSAFYKNVPAYYSNRLNIEYRGFNPYKREKYFLKVNDGNANYPNLGSSFPVSPPSGIGEAKIITAIDEEEFNNEAKSDWSQDYIGMHWFLITLKDPNIEVNKLVRVDFNDNAGKKLPISGKYVITKNTVEIRGGIYNNQLYVARRS